jgi:hypothetical protein
MRIRSNVRRLGDLPDLSSLSTPGTQALAAIAPTLTIATNLTPPVTLDLTGGGGGSSAGLMGLLQPTLTLNTVAGPVQIAPAGASLGVNSAVGTWAAVAGLGLAALVGFGYWLGANSK